MAGEEQHRGEMEEWADRYGSGRLRQALGQTPLPVSLYLEERLQAELPGFEIESDGSSEVEPESEPNNQARDALEVVSEHIELAGLTHDACELVRRRSEYGGTTLAILVRGWEFGHTVIGDIAEGDGTVVIGDGYPWERGGRSESPLRRTAYGSAYGLRHPAAQEALRVSAIISVDHVHDNGAEQLEEVLPPDARDLIDEELVGDFADTVYLVGWKFGQARRQLLVSLAEQIAGLWILETAEMMFDQRGEALSDAGLAQASMEIADCRDAVLDEMFLHEYLPSIDYYKLSDLVPAAIGSRRASIWAPWYPAQGEPAPRTIGDDEPEWSLRDAPGLTAREAGSADRAEREERKERERRAQAADFARLNWRLEIHGGAAYLLADRPAGDVACVFPPPALAGAPRISFWAWAYGRYGGVGDALDPEAEPLERAHFEWPEFFEVFPDQSHHLAVDAVFHAVEYTTGWVAAVGGHALAGGAVGPFEQSAKALEGLVAMRSELEKCRAAGLVKDARLTRQGIRHEMFGDDTKMRFLAEARFAVAQGTSFDETQGAFNQTIYDFSPLPVSLGLEPHEADDGSVVVRCAMGVDSIEEAHDLANEVITQIRWRVGLRPIDLDEGESVEDVGFEIIDLDHHGESDADTED